MIAFSEEIFNIGGFEWRQSDWLWQAWTIGPADAVHVGLFH
jgi:hypothetical protein